MKNRMIIMAMAAVLLPSAHDEIESEINAEAIKEKPGNAQTK